VAEHYALKSPMSAEGHFLPKVFNLNTILVNSVPILEIYFQQYEKPIREIEI